MIINLAKSLRGQFRYLRVMGFSKAKFDASKDYYSTLGVGENAEAGEIKAKYYELAKKYHPDVNSAHEEQFKKINDAYQVLSNAEEKGKYDEVRGKGRQRGGSYSYEYRRQDYHYGYRQQERSSGHRQQEQYYAYQSGSPREDKHRQYHQHHSPNLALNMRVLSIFITAVMGLVVFEFLFSVVLPPSNRHVVVVDRRTGEMYLTPEQELKHKLSQMGHQERHDHLHDQRHQMSLFEQEYHRMQRQKYGLEPTPKN